MNQSLIHQTLPSCDISYNHSISTTAQQPTSHQQRDHVHSIHHHILLKQQAADQWVTISKWGVVQHCTVVSLTKDTPKVSKLLQCGQYSQSGMLGRISTHTHNIGSFNSNQMIFNKPLLTVSAHMLWPSSEYSKSN